MSGPAIINFPKFAHPTMPADDFSIFSIALDPFSIPWNISYPIRASAGLASDSASRSLASRSLAFFILFLSAMLIPFVLTFLAISEVSPLPDLETSLLGFLTADSGLGTASLDLRLSASSALLYCFSRACCSDSRSSRISRRLR